MDRGTRDKEELYNRILLAIIEEKEDVSIRELPPLGGAIDIEALQTFLRSSSDSAEAEFQYLGRQIRVEANGRISMSEPNSDEESYIARCNTCGEEKQGVDMISAQNFFSIHAAKSHSVEIYRCGMVDPDHQPPGVSESRTEQAGGTD